MIEAKVKSLAHGGAFVCEITGGDSASSKKAFIRDVVPGEIVEASVVEEKKNLIEASLNKVLTPSPARRSPPCPLYGRCGGCDLQHMEISAQRQAKVEMVRDAIHFHAGQTPAEGVTLLGGDLPAFNYRRRIMLHCDPSGLLGFYRQKSGEVVDLENCLLASEGINRSLFALREYRKRLCRLAGSVLLEEHAGEVYLVIRIQPGDKYLSEAVLLMSDLPTRDFPSLLIVQQRRTVYARYRGKTFESVSDFPAAPGHFSQINEEANSILISTVLREVQEGDVSDLYAGSGNFSIPLAQRGIKVTAVELDSRLAALGRELAEKENLSSHLRFVSSSCEKFLKTNSLASQVILDPPRQGAAEVVKHFNPGLTGRVVYVSCSLPTLCRDLKILAQSGYRLQRVFALDMFPQTHHVETVSVLDSGMG